jgi:hypothetical protein
VTGAREIPVGYGVLALTYLGVAVAVVWLLRRLAGRPLPDLLSRPTTDATTGMGVR